VVRLVVFDHSRRNSVDPKIELNTVDKVKQKRFTTYLRLPTEPVARMVTNFRNREYAGGRRVFLFFCEK